MGEGVVGASHPQCIATTDRRAKLQAHACFTLEGTVCSESDSAIGNTHRGAVAVVDHTALTHTGTGHAECVGDRLPVQVYCGTIADYQSASAQRSAGDGTYAAATQLDLARLKCRTTVIVVRT